MAAEPRRRRPAARWRSARSVGAARLRARDREMASRRLSDRRSRESDRRSRPAALAGRPALLRPVIHGRFAVALCCGAFMLLAGCGSGNSGTKIPADTANRLIENIQKADEYNGNGLCARAHTKVRDARFVLTQ